MHGYGVDKIFQKFLTKNLVVWFYLRTFVLER
nr:MAG TPA: hypothetical protein [Caudoviricetes sp.]